MLRLCAWTCTALCTSQRSKERNRNLKAEFVIKEHALVPNVSRYDSFTCCWIQWAWVAIWGTSHPTIQLKTPPTTEIPVRAIPSPLLCWQWASYRSLSETDNGEMKSCKCPEQSKPSSKPQVTEHECLTILHWRVPMATRVCQVLWENTPKILSYELLPRTWAMFALGSLNC